MMADGFTITSFSYVIFVDFWYLGYQISVFNRWGCGDCPSTISMKWDHQIFSE